MGIGRLLAGLAPERFWRDTKCLFVLSTGRVGSTSIVKLLNLSSEILAYHEPHPQMKAESKEAYMKHGATDAGWSFDQFRKARGAYLAHAGFRGKIYAEATYMIYVAQLIHELLPNSIFLHLHRHPGEFIRSGMRRGWYDGHFNDRFRLEPRLDDPQRAKWQTWDRFSKIAWVWQAVNGYVLDLQQDIGSPPVLSLGFDRLFDVNSGAYARLFDFIGVPCPERHRVCAILNRKYNRQNDGEFPPYDRWTKEMKTTMCSIAGDVMVKLGYSIDI